MILNLTFGIYEFVLITIDNPEFEKYIPDIYPAELQLNKTNTSDKETSFLDLNIKVIGSDIHTSVYDKRDDFGFPIVNFPWLSGDVPRLPSYGIYISQLVRFARCCTSVLDFHSKNLQITSKLLIQGYRYHKHRTRHVFVKHGCPRWQQNPNMAKSLSPKFWTRPTPRGMGCQWSVRNPWMNLQSKFGYFMTIQTLNIALCL